MKKVVIRAYVVEVPDDQVEILRDLVRSEGEYEEDEPVQDGYGIATYVAHHWDSGDEAVTSFVVSMTEKVEDYPS